MKRVNQSIAVLLGVLLLVSLVLIALPVSSGVNAASYDFESSQRTIWGVHPQHCCLAFIRR